MDAKDVGKVHLIFKDGKFQSFHFHLENTQTLPENCVVVLSTEKVQDHDEFKKDNPQDAHEVE